MTLTFGSLFAGIGNAVVPQVAEWIGRRIVDVENGNQEDKS